MARCGLYVGRLVSHPCGERTKERCMRCGSLFCERHLVYGPQTLCVACAGTYAPPRAPVVVSEAEMLSFQPSDFSVFDGAADAGTTAGLVTGHDS